MKLLLYNLYFLACVCLATTCWKKKIKPKVDYSQLNQGKDSPKNGKDYSEKDLVFNEIDEECLPPLYKAVLFGDLKEVCRLLNLGSDPNVAYKDNYPLEVAVRKRNKEMVSSLLSHGAKIIFQEDAKSKVLDAVRFEKDHTSKEIYALLVSKLPPEEIDKLNLKEKKEQGINEIKNGSTLLLNAVHDNDLGKVKELLSLGADPNIAHGSFKFIYPLIGAIRNKNKEMVSLLLSHGAEVVFAKDGSSSVFNCLEVNNNQEILDIILCHFATKGKKDSVGLSPIHWACRDGHLSVVKHLLDKSPSLVHNSDNPYQFTPLHWAARRGFKEIVELLISKGASKTATSKSGFTPLMLAISNNHEVLKNILSPDGFSRHSKLVDKDWQCSICLEGLNDCTDKVFAIISLDCGHKFHLTCITKYVYNKHRQDPISSIPCPYCRATLSRDMVDLLCGYIHYAIDSNTGTSNTPLSYVVNRIFRNTQIDLATQILLDLIRQGASVNLRTGCRTPMDCAYDDTHKSILSEAGGIRSGPFEDIKPAFGLTGSKIEDKILFGKELEPRGYHAKL